MIFQGGDLGLAFCALFHESRHAQGVPEFSEHEQREKHLLIDTLCVLHRHG